VYDVENGVPQRNHQVLQRRMRVLLQDVHQSLFDSKNVSVCITLNHPGERQTVTGAEQCRMKWSFVAAVRKAKKAGW
jgi:hypothetical protein